jgi:hypothetical protein
VATRGPPRKGTNNSRKWFEEGPGSPGHAVQTTESTPVTQCGQDVTRSDSPDHCRRPGPEEVLPVDWHTGNVEQDLPESDIAEWRIAEIIADEERRLIGKGDLFEEERSQ